MVKSSFKWLAISAILAFGHPIFSQETASAKLLGNNDSLSIKIGQMVMIGLGEFNSPESKDPLFEHVKSGIVGGVVIYEKNIRPSAPATSLKGIVDRLQENSLVPLFISIDEEGGRVTRLKSKYGFPETKRADILGKWDNLDTTYLYAAKTASLLATLGINLNYAPDIDVNINPANPVIGSLGRSYGSDPYLVSRHAQEVVKAHRKERVGTVLKHFPGHGSSATDSHMDMTEVSNSWRFSELIPFKALLDSGYADGIMTAHIINEHLDASKVPATLSKPIITGILREFMGYQGVVFSDDMQMHAISKHFGTKNAIKMAIDAGVDVLMFANNVPQTGRKSAADIHDMILQMVLNGELTEERIDESYQRIVAMKRDLGIMPSGINTIEGALQQKLK